MKNNYRVAGLFITLFVASFSFRLLAQESPFTGQAAIDLGVNQNAELRSTINVPINIDVSSITGLDRGGLSTAALVAQGLVAVNYDPDKVVPVLASGEIQAGLASGFNLPHLANVHTEAGSTALYALLRNSSPSTVPDNLNLANVPFKLIGDLAETVTFTVATLDLRTPLELDSGGPSLEIFGGGLLPFTASDMTLSTLMPAAGSDVDNDGIEDIWEVQNSIDDPDADVDGDFISNIDEFLQGTNPNNAPPLVVISPSTETLGFATTGVLTFAATANDSEDGDVSGSILWVSDRDGSLGSGASVNAQLSSGRHVITATVIDANSESTIVTMVLIVGGRGMCPVGS